MIGLGKKEAAARSTARPSAGRARTLLIGVLGVGIALPLVSTVLGLYDGIQEWGKLVHAVDGLAAAFIFGMLFLAWRDQARVEVPDELAALLAICFGVLFGVLWEIIEFVRDWVAYSDLQKSNTDTMTDFLSNDVAVVIGALFAVRVYCRMLSAGDRAQLGGAAEWLVDGPSHLLNRHGLSLTVITLAVVAAAILVLWFAGRPVPGVSIP